MLAARELGNTRTIWVVVGSRLVYFTFSLSPLMQLEATTSLDHGRMALLHDASSRLCYLLNENPHSHSVIYCLPLMLFCVCYVALGPSMYCKIPDVPPSNEAILILNPAL
jgi:hypothetical protein